MTLLLTALLGATPSLAGDETAPGAMPGAGPAVASSAPSPLTASPQAPAQEDYLIPGVPPANAPPPQEEVQQIAWLIGRKLRCPVCRGQSISESTSDAAVQMLELTRDFVEAGYSEQQILDYYVARYSEWILLQPDATGLNLLLWLAPGLGVGLGVAWAAYLVMKWRKEPDEVPLPSDAGLMPKDRYEQRLLAELED